MRAQGNNTNAPRTAPQAVFGRPGRAAPLTKRGRLDRPERWGPRSRVNAGDRIRRGTPRSAISFRLRGRRGSGRQSYWLLIAATVVLSTVADAVQATSGTASSLPQPRSRPFFPIGKAGRAITQIQRAKAVCAACPVQTPMPRLRAADPPGLRHLGRPRRRRAPHPTPPAAAAPANLTARTHRSSLGPPHGHLGRAVGRPDDNQAEPRGQHRRQAALQPVRDLVFGLMQPGRSSALPARSARAGLQLPPPHRVALDGKPRDQRTDSGFSCPRWNGQHANVPVTSW
jgi:hypothetical protein